MNAPESFVPIWAVPSPDGRRFGISELSGATDVEGPYYQQSAIASGDVLEDLAAGTGGTNVHGNSDLTAAVNRLASPPEVRYLIRFSPSELTPDGSFHSLRVRVLNKGHVSIQARRGYFAVNPAEINTWQQIHDAVFSRDEMNDIPTDVGAQVSKPVPPMPD